MPYKDRKEAYENRKYMGICVSCPQSTRRGRTMCQFCSEELARKRRERADSRRFGAPDQGEEE